MDYGNGQCVVDETATHLTKQNGIKNKHGSKAHYSQVDVSENWIMAMSKYVLDEAVHIYVF